MNVDWKKILQAELAGAVVFLAVLCIPVIMLTWDRLPARQESYFKAQKADGAKERDRQPDPPEMARTAVETLSRGDKTYLLQGLFHELRRAAGATVASEPQSPPSSRVSDLQAPVFVSIYLPQHPTARASARGEGLAGNVRRAARKLVERSGFSQNFLSERNRLRARLDLLKRLRPMSARQRLLFIERRRIGPVGLALARKEGGTNYFLPADAAEREGGTPAQMLNALTSDPLNASKDAQPPEKRPLSVIEAVSFITAAPGTPQPLETPRGLVLVGGADPLSMRQAAAMATDYLRRGQRSNGSMPASYDVASLGGMFMGQASPETLSTAIYALSRSGGAADTCRSAVAWLVNRIYTRKGESGSLAFVKAEEQTLVSPGATGLAVAALCEFRNATGQEEFDGLIERLTNFLVAMQRDNGGFRLGYDASEGRTAGSEASRNRRWNESCRAALGLVLAYRELENPAHLLAAGRTLDRLTGDESLKPRGLPRPGTAWLAGTIREARTALPRKDYRKWLAERARAAANAQIGTHSRCGADLAGGCSAVFPPPVGATARQVEILSAAAAVEAGKDGNNMNFAERARRGARFLLQMQLNSANCYFVKKPDKARGAFLSRYGRNIASTGAAAHALNALTGTLREM